MYDDADEPDNNGDNNGEPMEESWSLTSSQLVTEAMILQKKSYRLLKAFFILTWDGYKNLKKINSYCGFFSY